MSANASAQLQAALFKGAVVCVLALVLGVTASHANARPMETTPCIEVTPMAGKPKFHPLVAKLCGAHPDAGNRTLAKVLMQKAPLEFGTLEKARQAVRWYRGNGGAKSKRIAAERGTYRPGRKPGEMPKLPESSETPWLPYNLAAKRVLSLSDIHLPFHSLPALEAAIEYGKRFKPDTILINGDLFDFYAISRWDKDPTKPKIKDELACGNQFFAYLRYKFPKADIVFRYGNHDRRWDKYLMQQAPMIFDVEGILDIWHQEAGIKEHGVVVVREQRPIMLGKLSVFHGDELPSGGSTVNPARGAFLRTLTSLLQAHLHRTSEHTERTLDGQVITCRTQGALAGLSPEYARINKWDAGFATVVVAEDGTYECILKRIIDGSVY